MSETSHQESNGKYSDASFLFIHALVDDAGLDASEFRIVCHLKRRQSEKRQGYAWPGKASIARACKLNEKTVERVLKDLLQRNVITEDRSQTHEGAGVYRKVNHPAEWRVPGQQPNPKEDPGARNGGGSKEALGGVVKEAPGGGPKRSPPKDIHTRYSKKDIQSQEFFPEALKTPKFEAAWTTWEDHLRERNRPLSRHSRRIQLQTCAQWGAVKAASVIENSISCNYAVLVEPKLASGTLPVMREQKLRGPEEIY